MEELRERARRAEERERHERGRAERYETELAELRKKHEELTTRLLAPAPKPGLLRRLFGG